METKKKASTSYGVDQQDDDEGHSSIKKKTIQKTGEDERGQSINAVGVAAYHLINLKIIQLADRSVIHVES